MTDPVSCMRSDNGAGRLPTFCAARRATDRALDTDSTSAWPVPSSVVAIWQDTAPGKTVSKGTSSRSTHVT